MTFDIADIALIKNIMFSFNAKAHKGRLHIALNGNTVFDGDISTLNVEPISLPKESLQPHNVLTFTVSDIGWKFWDTNEYSLEDVTVTGDITDVSTQRSKAVFLVTSTEKDNMEKAVLRFFADCRQESVGILDIALNDHNVYSSVPDCGISRPIEISPTILASGENTVEFTTRKGAYLIDQIAMQTNLKGMSNPTYYFELSQETADAVISGRAHLGLYLEFQNDIDSKQADIYVNGHPRAMNTADRVWRLGIDPFINPGNNVIELRPRSTLDIVNLRVAID